MSGRVTIALAMVAAACGCGRRIFYEWRDEPYLRPVYARGEEEARKRMRSRFADERDIGCRVLSVIAREAREAGDEPKARELARVLMAQYETEPSRTARSTLLAICLRNAGAGDEEVLSFLKERIAKGEEQASAAYTLAALGAPGSFEVIAKAYGSSRDPDRRYELLGALWLLGDARAIPIYEQAIAEIDASRGPWPEKIHHMKKDVYRKALGSRLGTLKLCAGAQESPPPAPATEPRRERE